MFLRLTQFTFMTTFGTINTLEALVQLTEKSTIGQSRLCRVKQKSVKAINMNNLLYKTDLRAAEMHFGCSEVQQF